MSEQNPETPVPPENPPANPETPEPMGPPTEGEGEGEGETETERKGESVASAEQPAAAGRGRRSSPSRRRRAKTPPEPGEGMQFCPLCSGEGEVPAEVAMAPDAEPCETCRGLGVVATGSLVPEHATIPCTSCHGQGYSTPAPTPTYPPAAASVAAHGPADVAAPASGVPLELPPLEPAQPAPQPVLEPSLVR